MEKPITAIQEIHKVLIEELNDLDGKTILDYGCGHGWALPLLLEKIGPSGIVIGADNNKKLLKLVGKELEAYINSNQLDLKLCLNPKDLENAFYDRILCHNVLECIDDKVDAINSFYDALKSGGTLVLSHHDFDSAIYNSSYQKLTRELIHHFSDIKAEWQIFSDGQMGRKLPGIFEQSNFKTLDTKTWRIVERSYDPNTYGFYMSKWLIEEGKKIFSQKDLDIWINDLKNLAEHNNFYFAIDVVVIKAIKNT